jgi:hypothetical protein
MRKLDLLGRTFGWWIVIYEHEGRREPSGRLRTQWLCRCVCGSTVAVQSCNLISGLSTKCTQCHNYGHNNPRWNGGPDFYDHRDGSSERLLAWKKDVFKREDYTCQKCKTRGGKLHAHHIFPWNVALEARYTLSNGACLCCDCHYTMKYSHSLATRTGRSK